MPCVVEAEAEAPASASTSATHAARPAKTAARPSAASGAAKATFAVRSIAALLSVGRRRAILASLRATLSAPSAAIAEERAHILQLLGTIFRLCTGGAPSLCQLLDARF